MFSCVYIAKATVLCEHHKRGEVLKYVSKCVTLIVRFENIFANSHLMDEISIFMDSKQYVDNFQPVFVAKTAKFHMKKEVGKFDDF